MNGIYVWLFKAYRWFLDNSKVCRWFVYNVCGVWLPSALTVIGYVGILIKRIWKAICRAMVSDGITTEVVVKNVGICFLIGLGFSVWLFLELLYRIIGLAPDPEEIHGPTIHEA